MTISERTRKLLWGRSGNRCALCRRELTVERQHPDDPSAVIGDECHIVARELSGPRGDTPAPADQRDEYDNLVLLCKVDHKTVDDQPNKFTVEYLKALKAVHEAWVRKTLAKTPVDSPLPTDPFVATRIISGEEALRLITSAHGHLVTNDGPDTEQEVEAIGRFLDDLRDSVDIWGELPATDQLSIQLRTRRQYELLRSLGFVAYGCVRDERMRFGPSVGTHPICYISLFRHSNPLVARKPDELEALFPEIQRDDTLSAFVLCARRK